MLLLAKNEKILKMANRYKVPNLNVNYATTKLTADEEIHEEYSEGIIQFFEENEKKGKRL